MTDCELLKTLIREHRLRLASIAGMARVTVDDIFSCVDGRRKIPKLVWSAVYELTTDARARNLRDNYDGILSSGDADDERPPSQVTLDVIGQSMRLFALMTASLAEFVTAPNLVQRLAARDRYETAFSEFSTHANAVNTAVQQAFTPHGRNACKRN